MIESRGMAAQLIGQFGCPLYVFDEKAFAENFRCLEDAFRSVYPNYRIAYSFKTNYAPHIVAAAGRLGAWAEVVSGMEYRLARQVGFPENHIIFNGPDKGEAGVQAFLNGGLVNADSLDELAGLCRAAKAGKGQALSLGLRVNLDLGQGFVSRFGIDPGELPEAFRMAEAAGIAVTGLHCHISRCRSVDAWRKRAEIMLDLADRYFDVPPQYIDLGSGMYGDMAPEFAAQFGEVPSYADYAAAVAGLFAEHYPAGDGPLLVTEPGTTLISRYVDMIARVDAIKMIRGKPIAVLNCSEHTLGETCTLKRLPIRVLPGGAQKNYTGLDMTGYTCLEQDVLLRDYTGPLGVGDFVVFGNVGGYSNVLKPPFIEPGCAMAVLEPNGKTRLIKKRERWEELFATYVKGERI